MTTTKYAVYDAATGTNNLYDTKDEALQSFWAYVVAIARSNFHGTAYTVVEQHEDGTETWYNDGNEEIDKSQTSAEIEAAIKKVRLLQHEKTAVEILP